jgi:hypothetical protein
VRLFLFTSNDADPLGSPSGIATVQRAQGGEKQAQIIRGRAWRDRLPAILWPGWDQTSPQLMEVIPISSSLSRSPKKASCCTCSSTSQNRSRRSDKEVEWPQCARARFRSHSESIWCRFGHLTLFRSCPAEFNFRAPNGGLASPTVRAPHRVAERSTPRRGRASIL